MTAPALLPNPNPTPTPQIGLMPAELAQLAVSAASHRIHEAKLELERAKAEETTARTHRNKVITETVAGGWSAYAVAKATGLSQTAIGRIIR